VRSFHPVRSLWNFIGITYCVPNALLYGYQCSSSLKLFILTCCAICSLLNFIGILKYLCKKYIFIELDCSGHSTDCQHHFVIFVVRITIVYLFVHRLKVQQSLREAGLPRPYRYISLHSTDSLH